MKIRSKKRIKSKSNIKSKIGGRFSLNPNLNPALNPLLTLNLHLNLTLLLAVAIFFVIGCGKGGVQRHQISGTVTYDGKPLEHGTITFQATAEAGKMAPTGIAKIENGAFRTKPDESPGGGKYIARVVGTDMNMVRELEKTKKELVGSLDLFQPYDTKVDIPPPGGQLKIDVPKQK